MRRKWMLPKRGTDLFNNDMGKIQLQERKVASYNVVAWLVLPVSGKLMRTEEKSIEKRSTNLAMNSA